MVNKGSGSSKQRGNSPRHSEHNAKGSRKNPFGKSDDKVQLLARMKAAAASRKATK
ncbi:MAG: hypothetical protein RMX62_00250 [Planktomarina sp.]|nr:hypothetical protein [Planktomarina sp.]|tara:strand:+ start:454 stop:621 length:168 start_codon:yes stop_codon:yes gene_type:complete